MCFLNVKRRIHLFGHKGAFISCFPLAVHSRLDRLKGASQLANARWTSREAPPSAALRIAVLAGQFRGTGGINGTQVTVAAGPGALFLCIMTFSSGDAGLIQPS